MKIQRRFILPTLYIPHPHTNSITSSLLSTCEFVGLTRHLAVSLRAHVSNSEISKSCKMVRAVSFKYPQRSAMEEVKARWEGEAKDANAPRYEVTRVFISWRTLHAILTQPFIAASTPIRISGPLAKPLPHPSA